MHTQSNSERSEVPTRCPVERIWLCRFSKIPLLITRAPLATSLATDISYSVCYLTVTFNWLRSPFSLNSIYPCTTNFVSPFMLTFLGYRHYSSIAGKDNGKAEFLLPEKVILTTLLPLSLTGLTFLSKIYLVVSPRRLSTGLVT